LIFEDSSIANLTILFDITIPWSIAILTTILFLSFFTSSFTFTLHSLVPLATLPVTHSGLIYLFIPHIGITGNPVNPLACDVKLQRKFLS